MAEIADRLPVFLRDADIVTLSIHAVAGHAVRHANLPQHAGQFVFAPGLAALADVAAQSWPVAVP